MGLIGQAALLDCKTLFFRSICVFSQDLEDLNLDDAKPDKKSKKKAKKAVNSDSEEEVEVKKVKIIYFMKIQ